MAEAAGPRASESPSQCKAPQRADRRMTSALIRCSSPLTCELDYYITPVMEADGKNRWELLICSTPPPFAGSEWTDSDWVKLCPASSVNSILAPGSPALSRVAAAALAGVNPHTSADSLLGAASMRTHGQARLPQAIGACEGMCPEFAALLLALVEMAARTGASGHPVRRATWPVPLAPVPVPGTPLSLPVQTCRIGRADNWSLATLSVR